MKKILGTMILLLVTALPCLAQLTKQDVRQIVREELEPVKLDIAEMKGKMATKDDIIAVKDDIIATRQNLSERMDTLYGVLIGILVAIIVAILSIIFTPFLRRWIEQREQIKDEKRLQRIETELGELRAIMEAAGEKR